MLQKINKSAIIIISLLVLATTGIFLYTRTHSSTSNQKLSLTSTVNLEPPTDEQKKQTDEHKGDIANQSNNTSVPQVTVIITSANINGINAYVSGVFEDNGTCTATITKENLTITKSSVGFKNATNTSCAPISLNPAEFSRSGAWQVNVSYNSDTSQGKSEPITIEVP